MPALGAHRGACWASMRSTPAPCSCPFGAPAGGCQHLIPFALRTPNTSRRHHRLVGLQPGVRRRLAAPAPGVVLAAAPRTGILRNLCLRLTPLPAQPRRHGSPRPLPLAAVGHPACTPGAAPVGHSHPRLCPAPLPHQDSQQRLRVCLWRRPAPNGDHAAKGRSTGLAPRCRHGRCWTGSWRPPRLSVHHVDGRQHHDLRPAQVRRWAGPPPTGHLGCLPCPER